MNREKMKDSSVINGTIYVVLIALSGIVGSKCQEISSNPYRGDRYRNGLFASVKGKSAKVTFKTTQVSDYFDCMANCLSHPDCQSFNFQTTGNPKHLCELSKDYLITPGCINDRPGYTWYYSIKHRLLSCPKQCKNGGKCEWTCGAGWKCKCQNYNKGDDCSEWTVSGILSCKDIYTKTSYRTNMAYTYIMDRKPTDIYCHLTDDICGGGGWTMVIKIDGKTKETFEYSSNLWSNKDSYNLTAGQTGFDNYQTKMPSYWTMPFQKLCVGFKVNDVLKWAMIKYSGSSLYDVIADGSYRSFSIGRNTWLSLVSGTSLQPHCNREGFNNALHGRHCRLGILGNNENDCRTPDTMLGLGLNYGHSCGSNNIIAQNGYVMIQ